MADLQPPPGWFRTAEAWRRSVRWLRRAAWVSAALSGWIASAPRADEQPAHAFELTETADDDADRSGSEVVEPAVLLPTDRGLERRFDRGRRLVAEGRWSDAVAALDELLAGESDAFLETSAASGSRHSIRTAVEQVIRDLPRPGREAYLLLTRATAERQLVAAIEAHDGAAILAVARRWFHTPAGRSAAMLVAVEAIEAGEPLTAAAWCDRLADGGEDDFGATLAVIRSLAHYQADDPETAVAVLTAAAGRQGGIVRVAGRDESLSTIAADPRTWLAEHGDQPADDRLPAGDWRQLGGHPGRNAIVAATRPLLVPRYRVPLVRHPDEAALLERRRREAADAGRGLIPAAAPLAVGGYLVTHTPLGILAIDFDSGRRLWLSSAVPAAGPAAARTETDESLRPSTGDRGDRSFDDATSGTLASDGRLVFAVESPPEALAAELTISGFGGRGFLRAAADWYAGNMLSAYDLAAGGTPRWRLPGDGREETDPEARTDTAAWYLGPPLVLGDELFVLVEREGEVALDVLAAADGQLRWSQPLATYDEDEMIANPSARGRRLAGLTPAFGGGLIVCPIGGGCIVAIDSATRSLAWAASYPRTETEPQAAAGDPATAAIQRCDPSPIVVAGRVVVRPSDADTLLCLDCRTGELRWSLPARSPLRVAGVVGGRVIVTRNTAVEAVGLETGRPEWRWPCPAGSHPSGRGILTEDSFILPLDTPEVVELNLADGSLRGRSVARGGAIPGHLVPYRGEFVSRGIDSLDVFHQEAALEERIETASRADPGDPWALYWRAQTAIERGDVAQGLDWLNDAAAAAGFHVPPAAIATAVDRAVHRDFAAVAARWPRLAAMMATASPPPAVAASVARLMVDRCLAAGDADTARAICEPLLDRDHNAGDLIHDPSDPALRLTAGLWLRSRVADLTALGAEPFPQRDRDESSAQAPAHAGKPAGHDDPHAAWPLGEVDCRRLGRSGDEAQRLGGMQSLPIEIAGGSEPDAVASRALFLMGERQLLVTDRLGRSVCEPLAVDGTWGRAAMPWTRDLANLEVAVLGQLLFIRTGAGLVCHNLAPAGDAARPVWSLAGHAREPGGGSERWGGGTGGRMARDGGIPLGMRIVEPDDPRRAGGRGLIPVPGGLIVADRGMVTMLDPATGRVRWERHRIAAGTEWSADAEALCGSPPSGRGSLVLACETGRLLQTCDLPELRQRLAVPGRRIVAVRSSDELPGRLTARRVRLDLVDPVDCRTVSLGDYPGDGRAVATGDGRLAVLAADGLLTVLDLADGGVVSRTSLPGMPARFERLIVQTWQDRYLVLAGGADEDDRGELSPLQPLLNGPVGLPPLSASIWAVDRDDGTPLWPTAATIERQDLLAMQPEAAPVLIFGRLLQPDRTGGESLLSVLCLDKRTGHAVAEDARLPILPYQAFGCQIRADAAAHAVTLEGGPGGERLTLVFTGRPLPPQPPYQSGGRPPSSSGIAGFLRRAGSSLPATEEPQP
jgi:outer membrane protein assembly factor BamB